MAYKTPHLQFSNILANMAVDPENEAIIRRVIPQIVRRTDSTVEMECVVALQVSICGSSQLTYNSFRL
jgi:hypothetical protein